MAESKCHHFGAPIFKTEMPKQPQTPQCPLFLFSGDSLHLLCPFKLLPFICHFITSFCFGNLHCQHAKGPTMLKLASHMFRPESDRCEADLLFFPKELYK